MRECLRAFLDTVPGSDAQLARELDDILEGRTQAGDPVGALERIARSAAGRRAGVSAQHADASLHEAPPPPDAFEAAGGETSVLRRWMVAPRSDAARVCRGR